MERHFHRDFLCHYFIQIMLVRFGMIKNQLCIESSDDRNHALNRSRLEILWQSTLSSAPIADSTLPIPPINHPDPMKQREQLTDSMEDIDQAKNDLTGVMDKIIDKVKTLDEGEFNERIQWSIVPQPLN